MGNFYKDRSKAANFVKGVFQNQPKESYGVDDLCLLLKSNTDLQLGKGIIRDILLVLENKGVIKKEGAEYILARKRAATAGDLE